MKTVKRLSLTLLAVLLAFSVFCVCVSAEGENNDIIQNDKVYAILPEGYVISGGYNGIIYFDEDINLINFLVVKNAIAPEGIQKTDFDNIKSAFIENYICDQYTSKSDVKLNITKTEEKTVNGLKAVAFRGNYFVGITEEAEDLVPCEFYSYAFATKENVFFVTYEQFNGVLDTKDLEETLKSFTVNGTFFEGESPTVNHSFEGAITYDEAVKNADEGLYSDIDAETMKIAAVFIYAFALIPTLVIVIVIIVVAVKYSKNKKQLRKYEARYGQISGGYAKPYPPTNNGYSPYTQGYNPQPGGYSPYTSNQYAQPPVQPVQPVQNAVENTENKENQ